MLRRLGLGLGLGCGPRSIVRVSAVTLLVASIALLSLRSPAHEGRAFVPGQSPLLYRRSTDPLSEDKDLVHGPWIATIPENVAVDAVFPLVLSCTHPNESFCPNSYYVQYYGPTAGAVPVTAFTTLSPRDVSAALKISEPGAYQVYAWPDLPNCSLNQEEGLYKSAVAGTPLYLEVLGPTSRLDIYRPCHNVSEILDGRWVRYEHVDRSVRSQYDLGRFRPTPPSTALFGLPQIENARYTYLPYTCKIPHRTAVDVLDALPNAKHVLFIGDSVTRNYVCSRVFADLWGEDNLGVCTYNPLSPVWEHGNKAAVWHDPENPSRAVSFTFAFAHTDVNELFPFFDTLDTPDFVVFNMGLWIDSYTDSDFKSQYRAFFEYVDTHWSASHVIIRSATSVVTPVQCFEVGGHSRENAYRMHELVVEATKEWAAKRQGKAKVSFLDAFAMTDSRPETTVDGMHWMYHSPRQTASEYLKFELAMRPAAGEAEDFVLDWMWDEMVSGRSVAAA